MLTTTALAVPLAVLVVLGLRQYAARLRREAGFTRVRVAELPRSVGACVRFRHPTDRRRWVEGRLLAVQESPLCVAWLRVHVEARDGSRAAYEASARDWAEVARQ